MHRQYPISQIALWRRPGLVASIALTLLAFPWSGGCHIHCRGICGDGSFIGSCIRLRLQRRSANEIAVRSLAAPGAYNKIALAKLLLVSGLSREFLSSFDEGTIAGIIRSFVT
jgi:hypothetical protein